MPNTTTKKEFASPSLCGGGASQRPGARWWEVLLIVLVFFAIAGEPVPHVNEAHYLSRLKHFWDPSWCAGDLFLNSPDAHGLFVWSFGWITKFLSLTATAWVGRMLAWTFLAWAWQRLSWRLVPVPLASVLTAALWVTLTETSHLAGEWVVGGVEAKCFAYAFVLLALRDVVDGRWNRAWILLGAACAFHVLVGGWTVVLCAGIWLKEKGDRSIFPRHARPNGKTGTKNGPVPFFGMLPGLVVGGLLALVGVVPAVALTWHQPPEVVAEANQIYVFQRLPHHLSLLTLPTDEIWWRIARHAILIAALWALTVVNRRVATRFDSGVRIVTWYAWGAVALAAIGFAIEIAFWNHPTTAAALLRYYWFRTTDVAVPLAVAFQAVALIATGFERQKPWAVWGLAAAIAVAGWHIAVNTAERFTDPVPPADAPMHDYPAWFDTCDWIAKNTPQDARFLTPRRATTFKWRTGRAEVATWKDIPQDAQSMVEWFHRLRNVFYYQLDDQSEPLDSVGGLGTRRAVEMARLYGADYIVTDQDHPLALQAVYPNREHPNDEYVVYAVPHANDRDSD
jgi:hypothetical protein